MFENENTGQEKQDWKTTDKIAGQENAGLRTLGPSIA